MNKTELQSITSTPTRATRISTRRNAKFHTSGHCRCDIIIRTQKQLIYKFLRRFFLFSSHTLRLSFSLCQTSSSSHQAYFTESP